MKKIGIIIASLVLMLFVLGCTGTTSDDMADSNGEPEAPTAPADSEGIEGDLAGLDDLESDLDLGDLEDLGDEFSL